jgi:hypothetical protein
MAGTDINDTLFTAGQNEGIDLSVVPLPQLRSVENLRLRKSSRWGKRFGHTALSTTGFPAGSMMRAMGGGKGNALTCWSLANDQCRVYDQTAAAFVNPLNAAGTSPLLRVAGAASGWLPDSSFFPVPVRSLQNQTTTPCATCFAFGYLWTAVEFGTGAGTDKQIRIVATEPSDQTVVRVDDHVPTTAGFGGNRYPKLVLVGSTLVLTYALTTAGTTNIIGRTLASVSAAWSGETTIVNAAGAVYDASGYSTTRLIVAMAAAGSSVNLVNTALAVTNTQAIADVSGNPLTEISCVGAGAEVYVGYACAATPSTKVRVFTTNLAGTVGTATLTIVSAKRPLMALVPGAGVRAVYNSSLVGGVYGTFSFRDVTAGAVAGANQMDVNSAYPIGIPLAIGSNIYLWTKTETGSVSYATLLKLPDFGVSGTLSAPIEMSVQDYIASTGQGLSVLDLRGVPTVAQLGTSGAYAIPVASFYTLPSAINSGHDFRILQARHYTDISSRRSLQALYVDSSAFLPMGALTRMDDRGATEEGFLHAPTIIALAPAAGAGALTPLSDYYYTAIYKARNSNGRFEVSAPAAPVKVSMGAGQNQTTVTVLSLGMTARPNVSIEIYRTTSNGTSFQLDAVIDSGVGAVNFLDQLSDAIVGAQQALYTQVGQTLPNVMAPPSRFGCVGGQRVLLGGQMRADVVQASKLLLGDQSPSFADSDAFRIVLPAACTGTAWMDVWVLFTAEGIYIASGDGPDDSGIGDFGSLTRMPYELGCIEPRSVIVAGDGCFFQTSRGLYMLPRGFGVPVPAGDAVQDRLASFPVICGCAVLTKPTEQTIHWICSDANGFSFNRIVYDLVNKAWSVDYFNGFAIGVGQWSGGETVVFTDLLTRTNPLLLTNSSFDDAGDAIVTQISTGFIRPFGVLSEGVISKIQLLAEVRSACTLTVFKLTEFGGNSASRTFALAAGDYQIGQYSVTEIWLGNHELRDAMHLLLQIQETSTSEGLALIAMSIEHERGEGLKRVFDLSRIT